MNDSSRSYPMVSDEAHASLDATRNERRRALAHTLLLDWYATEGRAHLPWRHTRDPYAVLVSEVMLQQTQVERVLPKYAEWLAHFPTLESLAAAPTSEVIKAWAGLGYNTRAVRLQAIARQAMSEYGGALPNTLEGLLALKGIGRYTAGAVACFAFGLPIATVDTNIRRVLWRVFRGVEPARWPTDQRETRAALAQAEWALPLPAARAYDWQQALMDLGATICLSRRPACERCPLISCCAAYAEAAQVTLFPSGEAIARLRDERASLAAEREATILSGERQVAERRAGYTTTAAVSSAPIPLRKRPRAATQPFTETTRYYRGRIVETLRALEPGMALTLAELGPRVKSEYTDADLDWLRGLVSGLVRDGLAHLDSAPDGRERVSLPT